MWSKERKVIMSSSTLGSDPMIISSTPLFLPSGLQPGGEFKIYTYKYKDNWAFTAPSVLV